MPGDTTVSIRYRPTPTRTPAGGKDFTRADRRSTESTGTGAGTRPVARSWGSRPLRPVHDPRTSKAPGPWTSSRCGTARSSRTPGAPSSPRHSPTRTTAAATSRSAPTATSTSPSATAARPATRTATGRTSTRACTWTPRLGVGAPGVSRESVGGCARPGAGRRGAAHHGRPRRDVRQGQAPGGRPGGCGPRGHPPGRLALAQRFQCFADHAKRRSVPKRRIWLGPAPGVAGDRWRASCGRWRSRRRSRVRGTTGNVPNSSSSSVR